MGQKVSDILGPKKVGSKFEQVTDCQRGVRIRGLLRWYAILVSQTPHTMQINTVVALSSLG